MLNEPSANRRSQSPPQEDFPVQDHYITFVDNFATTPNINIIVIDLHNDALLELPANKLLPYLRQTKLHGVDEIWLSVWTTELKDPLPIITKKRALLNKIDGNPKYPICRLHIEDAWFLTMENIDKLIALKPHSVGLTWNNANNLAGGAHSKTSITPLGYQVIKQLENAGIQVDTAHLNRRSFWQFARITTRPIICTHTAINAVHRHPRNLTNSQIRKITKSGGFIGLALVPQFLTHTTTSCSYITLYKHILYYKNHFRTTTLHWGTDFYGTQYLPQGIKNYQDIYHILNSKVIGYSILKKPIIAFQIGNSTASQRILITAGMHAREWITSLALQNWLKQNITVPNDVCIIAIPQCNPDGIKLAQDGYKHLPRRRQKFLYHVNHKSSDFTLWKANIRAVDLNVNFDANWGQGAHNITKPAPANYIGPEPHSEPENRAILKLIKNFKPTVSIALHSKGNVIYYSRTQDQPTAEKLSTLTNFPAILSSGSFGGLTDYLALKKGIPSFTIELGDDKLKHPISADQLENIMPKLSKIIDYFLTGE